MLDLEIPTIRFGIDHRFGAMESNHSSNVLIDKAALIFWDFDGVIKDSVGVKTAAFEKLFFPYGQEIAQKVKNHHEANVGVSRYEKMPLYLAWAGEKVTDELLEKFNSLFSEAVFQSVIESPWVPGVYEYLSENYLEKKFVLVTATPQVEIDKILCVLKISRYFQKVIGAPAMKKDAVRSILEQQKNFQGEALMIGDAETDLLAAQANSINFLLRRTPENLNLQSCYDGPQFDELSYE